MDKKKSKLSVKEKLAILEEHNRIAKENPRTYQELKSEIQKPKAKGITKYAKISNDKKSLLIRIPLEIKKDIGLTEGQYFKFFIPIENQKAGKIQISICNTKDE
jgi:septum formation topological specificity factor MinE